MTQNARCCAGYGKSLRRDTQDLARATGTTAGAFMWGSVAVVSALFWPSIFVHGAARGPCEGGWYGFLGLLALCFITAKVMQHVPRRPRVKIGPTQVPSWPPWQGLMPDLRDSGEFEGRWN